MLFGLATLIISGSLWARPSPTDASCQAAFWLTDLGWFFTFGPLFAKAWVSAVELD